jgi:hypothetical protein
MGNFFISTSWGQLKQAKHWPLERMSSASKLSAAKLTPYAAASAGYLLLKGFRHSQNELPLPLISYNINQTNTQSLLRTATPVLSFTEFWGSGFQQQTLGPKI